MSVLRCRSLDMTWSRIGYALGTSGQAAWERYGLTAAQRQERSRQREPAHVQLELAQMPEGAGDVGERLEPRETDGEQGQAKET